ncbi:MAG: hypothetical protein OSA99_20935 [Acidimicrobiales bacterium]|nr:hypothetical protein [Acidimicrobiales bacterium]
MTARWVVDEVRPHRDLTVTWQPISLFFKNEPDADSDYFEPLQRTHGLLRVIESVRSADDSPIDAVESLYIEYGRRIHHDQSQDFDPADALRSVGLDARHAQAFDEPSWDAEIRTRMDRGLALTGDDVGTPIIAFDDRNGTKQGYFGPVITRVPSTEDSLAMWDALVAMMNVDGFWELKRTRTQGPEFGDRP